MKTLLRFILILFILSQTAKTFAQQYFQQEINTKINVTLNDIEKNLNGDIKIEYINNSATTLEYIYIHLWANAYSSKNTAFAQQQIYSLHNIAVTKKDFHKGFIDSLDFHINDIKAELFYISEDVGLVTLPEPLQPGDTMLITTDFFVQIPDFIDRLGYSDNFFSITQWFPKPAVYDKYGWHPMSYLSMGEFYSEFGNYDVTITLRDDFIVASTGNLTTRKELDRLENYAKLCRNTKDVNDLPPFGNPMEMKTINFVENNIHDFAWFASPDFIVDHDFIKLENTGKNVNCWTFYNRKNANIWNESVEYVKKAVNFFSSNIGEYPYNNCIAVDRPENSGTGGMEYPTITLVGAKSRINLERVIVHETGHNWFYGILASNERDDPWIDEGFTTFYENKYFDHYYPDMNFMKKITNKNWKLFGLNKLPSRFEMELAYNYIMHENMAQKPATNSQEMSVINYFTMSYYKSALAIYTLEEYLGSENFNIIIKDFYNAYKFKHIYPESLQEYFTTNSEKNTDWFFYDLISSNKKTDYKVSRLKNDSIIIKNKGDALTPLFLNIGDSLIISDGFKGKKKFALNGNTEIIIDKEFKSLDYNRSNNFYTKGFFKKYKPVKISIANIIDNPLITEIPVLPAIGYNYTDGFMAGLLLYSTPIPKRKFEYQLMPMWAFGSETLTGFGNLSLYFHPKRNMVREFEFFTSGRRFTISNSESRIYHKISSGLKIKFRTNPAGQSISEILLRNVYATDYYTGNMKNFQQIKYSFANYRRRNPYCYNINLERGDGFVKSSLEIENTIHYNYKQKGLKIRLFIGKFLYNSDTYYGNYDFRLSGNLGMQDYLYDDIYIGRNQDIRSDPESFLAHQFTRNDGGFTLFTPFGQTNNWLIALNFDSHTPIKTINLYMNLGSCADSTRVRAYYELGIKISLLKDIINIYFPITGTKEIWDNSNDIYTKNYIQKIRFTLSLRKLIY